MGLKIVDAIDLHYCADCGEPINFSLMHQQGKTRGARFPERVRFKLTYPPDPKDPAGRQAYLAYLAERRLETLKNSPVILPGACPACGGGRVASRRGKDLGRGTSPPPRPPRGATS